MNKKPEKSGQQYKMFYYSTIKGVESEEKDVFYLGRVYRIPEKAYGTEKHLQYEIDPQDLLKDLGDLEPIPGGTIERYEVRDINTGDVHVMYRVPYRPKKEVIRQL